MSFWAAWATALAMVWRNTLRSSLAMVGIIIAVVAVVGTVAVGEGAQKSIARDMAKLGQNLMFISAQSAQVGGVRAGAGTGTAVTVEDVEAIARQLSHVVAAAAPMVRSAGQAVVGHSNWATSIVGTTPAFFVARGWDFAEGGPFTADDVARGAKRCVLGAHVHKQLFGEAKGLGQVVRVRGMMCQVVGVLRAKGAGGFGPDQDDMLVMPLSTLRRRIAQVQQNRGVTAVVQAPSAAMAPVTKREVVRLLRQRHRLGPGARDDFSIFNLAELQQSAARQARTLSLVLSGVAAISLLVGAIGIANVMLVAVTERTREIGLRMAVGARAKDIRLQFLLEAITLSLAGALVGLGLGCGGAAAVAAWTSWPVAVNAEACAWAVAAASLAGIAAGLFPALRAAKLDPITALRFD